MKTRKYQATEEKTILLALLTHDRVLSQVYDKVGKQPQLFPNKWSNQLAQWCFDYHVRYHKAPRASIQSLFGKYAQTQKDENSVSLMEAFLTGLNKDYEALAQEINEKYVMDLASHYFEKTGLERAIDQAQAALERGELKEAKEAYQSFQPIQFADDNWSYPFAPAEVQRTLTRYEQHRSLIDLPGDMGHFLSPYLEREGFIVLAGPEKVGKSFWLGELVWRALLQRCRVLYYVIGDMSRDEVNYRLYQRSAMRPAETITIDYPIKLKIKREEKDEKGRPQAELEVERREFAGLSARAIRKAAQRLSVRTASKTPRLKIKCAGAHVISAGEIERDVRDFSEEGWVPDVVALDYADLLAPEPLTAKMDYRHQVNASWEILRRIGLDYHCLLLTATQIAARGYDAWVLRKKDFSEDKRKNAHVTGMCGINQTPDEKDRGIYRLNWPLLRGGRWTEQKVLWTAGCLELACPCIKNTL